MDRGAWTASVSVHAPQSIEESLLSGGVRMALNYVIPVFLYPFRGGGQARKAFRSFFEVRVFGLKELFYLLKSPGFQCFALCLSGAVA